MKIKAAVVNAPGGEFCLEAVELSAPQEDEVLVRMVAVGICHTDLAGRDMHLPIPEPPSVFGHEGAGVVEAVGSRVTKVRPGDHVLLAWDSCGRCAACKSGRELYCLNFFLHNFHGARPDGSGTLSKNGHRVHGSFFCQSSFAEYALAGERNTVKVREDIPLEVLAPLGCGIMTGAGAVMNAFQAAPGSSLAVFGIGPVGMSAVMAAVVCGCTTVIAVDVIPERLRVAAELGATHTLNARETDPVAAIRELTSGGPNYSLECVGNPAVFRQAVDVLPRLGVCGLTGVVPPGTEVTLDMDLIMNGRTVRGILGGDAIPDLFLPRLIELHRQGRFPLDRLITLYPFDRINQAAADMEQGRVIKPVLRF